ncbi:MAG TPA: CDP-alcohol phosphatidyltransferase family protein [Puia sp.]|nr:CDP-alcohol phosphatidyltransferase family protein [Puia sp.]
MKQLPNLFTLLNLFFGCIAIIFILQNGISVTYNADGAQLITMPEQIWMSSLFIALAALVDFLDGFVARLFKATSDKGKQLDSLADVVSFGVAPGMILYQFLRMSFIQQHNGMETSLLWLLPAFIFPCAAAYRLAKFNIDSSQQYVFKGMPSPAAGLLIASMPLIYWHSNLEIVLLLLMNKWFLYAITVVVSYLMVCNISLIALKFTDFSVNRNLPKIILLIVAVVAALLLKWLAVPVVFIFYIIISLIFKNKTT